MSRKARRGKQRAGGERNGNILNEQPEPKADGMARISANAPPAETARSPLYVGSMEKGMKVLMAFQGHPLLRLKDVVCITGLDKSAAQRFVFTLTALGYLLQDSISKCYTLTPKILRLAHGLFAHSPLVQRAMPYLLACGQKAGETVSISILDETEMVYIARVPGPHRLDVYYSVGDRYPVYCTGGGLAFLSALSPDRVSDILDRIELVRLTQNTMTDREALMTRLAAEHERGYAISNEEMILGSMSVAAPVLDPAEVPVAIVSISAPIARWSLDEVERQLVPLVMETTREISL